MLFLFALVLLANAVSPNGPQTCKNVTISPQLWQQFYPTVWHYQGFNRAQGYLTIYDPTGAIVPAQYLPPPLTANPSPISGIFHQYLNGAGQNVGDLYLDGFAPIPILVTRQISNPVISRGTVCQNFIYSLVAPDLLTSYSEISPSPYNDDYMATIYVNQDGRTFSDEDFKIDSVGNTSWSRTSTYALGSTLNTNYLSQTAYFKYNPITETQAIALGYNPATIMP